MSVTELGASQMHELPTKMIETWATNDGAAFSDLFTEDATLILPNDIFLQGRDGIRGFMTQAFAGPYQGTRVFGEPLDARYLGEDAGVIVTQGGVLAPGDTAVAPERAIRATWVLARQDGRWLIAAYQNTPINA
ncbi:SgcJ/EcaC family oxidoreductase [Lentzea sp. E54]|uniref:SgcJ/EcaC family oxidoreductase n=1 Tax=Lentzea xerophila TaxID=3435883 RepID=UPI003DA3E9FB